MRRIYTTLIFLMLLSSDVFARLGETIEALEKRFGKPTQHYAETTNIGGKLVKIGERYIFRQDEWFINAIMMDEKCTAIIYTKSSEITEEQLQYVLDVNRPTGSKWKKQKEEPFKKEFTRPDGAKAVFNSIERTVDLTSKEYDDRVQAITADAKKKSAKIPNF